MKRFFTVGITVFAALAVTAGSSTNEPPELAATKVRVKCVMCKGRGRLKVSPPDVGQFEGKIEHRSYWDVKIDRCPFCRRGWRMTWDLAQPEPSADAPCTKCGWSGIIHCRKCLASGIADCPRSDCKEGWIIEKSGRGYSSRRKAEVRPCQDCKGIGKIVCPACQGMRATLCNRCFGTGKKNR